LNKIAFGINIIELEFVILYAIIKSDRMKTVIEFLDDLARNNDRDWFGTHRDRYTEAKRHFDDFAERYLAAVAAFDPSVAGIAVKDATYRIYRDTRFSADKSPYKTYMGVFACPRGKKSGNAGYYLHIEPATDTYLLCSGFYPQPAGVLRSIREEIMVDGEAFEASVEAASGFDFDWRSAYKRMPRGCRAEDEYSRYYLLRDFCLNKYLDRECVLADDFLDRAVGELSRTRRYTDTLNRCIEYAREMGW